jgi:hypothetical protein
MKNKIWLIREVPNVIRDCLGFDKISSENLWNCNSSLPGFMVAIRTGDKFMAYNNTPMMSDN